jgi:hypothetical protein
MANSEWQMGIFSFIGGVPQAHVDSSENEIGNWLLPIFIVGGVP